ncbi:MAG: kynurenine formamidase [Planctomycetota bacterium]|nr:MAG: kynurenine formamidase [Planctomycetota bacterium]
MTRLYDITPPIAPGIAVWPGDTPLSREILLDMKAGANITLSTLRATVHLGAHADGPNHYGVDGPAIHDRSLTHYLGPCQVISVGVGRGSRVMPEHVSCEIGAPRVLVSTGTYPDPLDWNDDFAALSPELVDWLAARRVITVGIDTPSVDLFSSKDLPAHRAILRHDMAILEGIVLSEVPDGVYELIALPLPLVGFDASPVRAVLRAADLD